MLHLSTQTSIYVVWLCSFVELDASDGLCFTDFSPPFHFDDCQFPKRCFFFESSVVARTLARISKIRESRENGNGGATFDGSGSHAVARFCESLSNPCGIMCSLCLGSVHGSMEPAWYTSRWWEVHWTPLVLPIRGCVGCIKAMMKGDVYIGRGCRQRGLKRSPYCKNHKFANYGRRAAVELFEKHLLSPPHLLEELWTLSGCRLACHCRLEQDFHGDVIIRQFRLRFPSAYDRNDPLSAAPKTNELQYLAK